MKITSRARYAVMAVVEMAKGPLDRPIKLATIAARQQISLPYLEQLFAALRRGGIVSSVKGPGGGYLLAQPGSAITIADVIEAVDKPIRATRCDGDPDAGCIARARRCDTHELWAELDRQVDRYLYSVSVADVLADDVQRPRPAAPLPAVPQPHREPPSERTAAVP